ncbi:peptidoglycan recognition protein family protein [Actinomadura hibisca]|uniref:peptidoglycan recognition protein family protein n=1 Tax=Actinomadura hibisca TaxID=68565 RepID=UPI000829AF8E|nr:peptidoglycan recognition family protein [Actinomadura hibisca]
MKLENRSVFGWPPSAAAAAPCRDGLVVHYDGSNQGLAGKGHDACRTYWRNTRKFHMGPSRNWADIGYSFAVCPHGVVLEGRGFGRVQAAQPGGNNTWTSVTFMSGDAERPTAEQVAAFKELRAWLRGKGVAGAVRGHRDFISTSCPGSILYGMVRDGSLTGNPQEDDDMPLSDADLKKIRDIVWNTDTAPAPGTAAKDNPTWRHVNILRDAYSSVQQVKATLAQLARQSPDVDEAEVARLVLADLTPERIAAAIPAELAGQVVDQLAVRLNTPKE